LKRLFFTWIGVCFFLGSPLAGVFIKFDSPKSQKTARLKKELQKKGAQPLRRYSNLSWEVWNPPPEMSNASFLASLMNKPGIENISLSTNIKLFDTFPNDTDFLTWQWALHSSTHPEGDINAPESWDITTGTRQIVVAVIDTGIDFTHPDLAANLWQNPAEIPGNSMDDDGNGYIDDVMGWDFNNNSPYPLDPLGHGTHVSGIIGGVGNNGIGIAGVCWNTNILSLKVFDQSETPIEVILEAFDYLLGLEQTVPIINASWGGRTYSEPLKDAIEACRDKGMLFFCAAGNEKMNNSENPVYPANFNLSNIVSVGATDVFGNLWVNSDYGPSVSICAPGASVYSTLPAPLLYGRSYGTSMASPHVAGAASLLLSKHPGLSLTEVRNHIIGSAEPSVSLKDRSLSQGLLHLPGLFCDDAGSPSTISDLTVTEAGLTTATLTFSLPYDDNPGEPVKVVELRCSRSPLDEVSWWEADPIPVIIERGSPGELRTVLAKYLVPDSLYYFAARSLDECGNQSPLSNIPWAKTIPARVAYLENFETGAPDWEVGCTLWDVATSPGLAKSGKGFLIHPELPEPFPETDVALSPWIDLSELKEPYLAFSHQFEFYGLERFTNQGRVEILEQGKEQWKEIARFKIFYSPWRTESIYLGAWRGKKVRIRFNFVHVFISTEDHIELGWWIDDVRILETKEISPVPCSLISY